MRFVDTHYHLGFIQDDTIKISVLNQLAIHHIESVAQTLRPSEFYVLNDMLNRQNNTSQRLSLGFHPWYIDDVEHELALFEECLEYTRYIGEIGLDFAPGRLEAVSKDVQEDVFRRMLTCIFRQNKVYVLSIHTVHSASRVMDILEEFSEQLENVNVIFHRFNGTQDELRRILKMGGYFSVHPSMVTSKKGRSYIQYIPDNRLLLETDLPNNEEKMTGVDHVQAVVDAIHTLCDGLVELKGESIIQSIQETQVLIYGK